MSDVNQASGTAALLIDYENFFLGREKRAKNSRGEYDPADDLEYLTIFVRELCESRRLIVKRAYADFNTSRPGKDRRDRRDYFLRRSTSILMANGIEPVQVFRFAKGNSKNAADMRMAMDAGGLTLHGSTVEQFILVTGDADFVPVCLELRRRGALVMVIGVQGSTGTVVQRYCDRFEFFEEMIAAHEVMGADSSQLGEVGEALSQLLRERDVLQFAAVKPLLGSRIPNGFDPENFGCENTGEFLREYEKELGVVLKRGKNDWEVRLPSDKKEKSRPARTVEHSVDAYKKLLKANVPKIFMRTNAEWQMVTEKIMTFGSAQEAFTLDSLHDAVVEQCTSDGLDYAPGAVKNILFQLDYAGCFVPTGESDDYDGTQRLEPDVPVAFAPDISDLDALRQKTQRAVIELLRTRLQRLDDEATLDEGCVADLFFGGESDRKESAAALLTSV